MEERIYKIKAEVIGRERDMFLDKDDEGITCNGFTVIGDEEDGARVWIHRMSLTDIAQAILGDGLLLKAAKLAVALEKAGITGESERKDGG